MQIEEFSEMSNASWDDGDLELKECFKLSFSQPTHKYGKIIMTCDIPYNETSNKYLYRNVISKLRWLRYVFENEEYEQNKYIVKRSNAFANQLFFSAASHDEILASRDIVTELVTFKFLKPEHGVHTNAYTSPYTRIERFPSLDVDKALYRVEGDSDICVHIGKNTNTQVHAYYDKNKGGTLCVIQGRKEDQVKATACLKAFAEIIAKDESDIDGARAAAISVFDSLPVKPAEPPTIPETPPSVAGNWIVDKTQAILCTMCRAHPRRVTFLPCHHLSLCAICNDNNVMQHATACNMCGERVVERVIGYIF